VLRFLLESLAAGLGGQDAVELFLESGRHSSRAQDPRATGSVPRSPLPGSSGVERCTRPYLAIELLSPTTAARDRNTKRRIYLEAGVEEYWIVDTDARVVERWHRGDDRPEIVTDALRWSLEAGVSGTVDLTASFRRVFA
jgi:Putative restriction endonuclease